MFHDLSKADLTERHRRLLAIASDDLGIHGPGDKVTHGMHVRVSVRNGQVYISIDGCNIVRITGAQLVEIVGDIK